MHFLQYKQILCSQLVLVLLNSVTLAKETYPEDLSLIYGSKRAISIASGHQIPEDLSPAVTSVITSDDIENIGVRRLEEVLEYLPGVHISLARSGNSIIGFRGISSEGNSQILMMINGVPVRNPVIGGKPLQWTMPVKNIAYIEVIRGAGSMLYGGDATTGVINVVLKNGNDLHGGSLGSFVGNKDTYEGFGQYGNKKGDWEYAFSVQGGSTHGDQGILQKDTQTALDEKFHTHASLAPGSLNNGRNDMDARIDIAYKDWGRFRAGYQGFKDVGSNAGAAYALDPTGKANDELYNMDFSIKNREIGDHLKTNLTAYYLGQDVAFHYTLLPSGTFGGLFPNGQQQILSYLSNTTGLDTQTHYTGIHHHLTLGAGYSHIWLSHPSNQQNYQGLTQIPITTMPFLRRKTRTNLYAFLQDEWNFAQDFYLTTGLRYDYYSDEVDGAFSPRASLVWNIGQNFVTKLLYTRSFRPPAFFEQYQFSTPVNSIKPEIMNTVEFQIEKGWSSRLKTAMNVYWFELSNFITSTVTLTYLDYMNSKNIEGVGVETYTQYRLNDTLALNYNYSYHGVSRSENTGLLPEHMMKGVLNWHFMPNWNLGLQMNWIGDRKRAINDSREPLNGYFLTGITLSNQISRQVEIKLRVNNLFGVTAKEPSSNSFLLLSNDIPVFDRTILGQIQWQF